MVWNQRGKKGVHCGRTLRRNVSTDFRSRGLDKKGLITKYQRHAESFAHSLKESLVEDRYGLVDGLTLSMSPPRNAFFHTNIEFSLGKRKRWRIPELIQEKMSLDSEETFEEEEEDEEGKQHSLNVCFVERHIHPEMSRSKGDCLSFFSDKDGKLLTPKHKYSYQTDLRHRDKDERPAEICYEICRPTPPTSWPNMKEGASTVEKYDKLGQIKNRGKKSKDLCWRFYETKEFLSDISKPRHTKSIEAKIKTVANKQFSKVLKQMESSNGKPSLRFQFPMGHYIDTLLKRGDKESAEEMKCEIQSGISLCPVKMGKGCAVFIDPEPSTKLVDKVESFVYPDSISLSLEDPKCQIEVDILLQDLKMSSLESEWNDLYFEGRVSPRKFSFDISSLLPNTKLGVKCVFILFEVDEKVSKGKASAKTMVSLVPVTLGSELSDYTKATKNFVSNIVEANKCMSAPLRIKEIVNAAVDVYTSTPGDETKPMEKTDKNRRSLGLLNEMCGWKSESYSLEGAKQQLKDDYYNELKEHSRKGTVFDLCWMLSIECGICFERLEGEDNMLTSLKECGHAFCNDCWKGHLKVQIHQSIQCIKCPGQSCESHVDDMIIMSIVPLWYQRFLNMKLNKKLETSPNWKWCPGTGCKKVVKATAHGIDELTALCDCGMAWCFKCKQPSHWPATCIESKTFDKIGKDYKEALMGENKELITSVMVKNCPNCDYPIEKYYGCQFMSCVLCGTSFCWNCCTPATYSHQCDKDESHNLDKVELSFNRKKYHFEKFLNIVVKSIQARGPKKLVAKSMKAKALGTSAKSYEAISSNIAKEVFTASDISRVMEYIIQHGLPQTLQEAVEFEFQAHLVLEGFAKKAAVSKTKCRSGILAMSRLGFVVDRIDSLCQEPFSLCKDDKFQKLKELLTIGKDCILTLKKYSCN